MKIVRFLLPALTCFLTITFSQATFAEVTFFDQVKEAVTYTKKSPILVNTDAPMLSTRDAANELKFEVGGLILGASLFGVVNWDWGSTIEFEIADEDWLGIDTHSGGSDKIGHMYSAYLINDYLTHRLKEKTNNAPNAAAKAALLSSGVMLWVEFFDGFSVNQGFSYEDIVFNTLGVGLSYLENTVPGLDEKIDFRVEYHPTHNRSAGVVTDYTGHTFFLVGKLAGFESLRNTPLKYFDLHLGYHAQGFKKNDNKHYKEKSINTFVGIGLNLSEVLFKPLKKHTESPFVDYADTFFQYYQAPGIYTSTSIHEETAPF